MLRQPSRFILYWKVQFKYIRACYRILINSSLLALSNISTIALSLKFLQQSLFLFLPYYSQLFSRYFSNKLYISFCQILKRIKVVDLLNNTIIQSTSLSNSSYSYKKVFKGSMLSVLYYLVSSFRNSLIRFTITILII